MMGSGCCRALALGTLRSSLILWHYRCSGAPFAVLTLFSKKFFTLYCEFEILSSHKTKLRRLASLLLPFFIMNSSRKTKNIVLSALIAGAYTALTFLSFLFGLDKGVIQFRLSECLAILPAFTPSATWGLFIGCFLSGLLTSAHPLDMVFGSLVTLLAAVVACLLHRVLQNWRGEAFFIPLPNILFNSFLIPILLQRVYGVTDGYWFLCFTVGVGEIVTCGVLGVVLYFLLRRRADFFRF